MGNKISQKSSFNIREVNELSQFISNINMLDGFFMDTTLSISSKCLVIINNLINDDNYNVVKFSNGIEIPRDDGLIRKIEKLKFHCGLIRHLAVVNSSSNHVEEMVELNNVHPLASLTLDNVSIRLVQHLKQHRNSLLKLCVYHSLNNLESLINLCGGDHSFNQNWTRLMHLDVRYNNLRSIGDSVTLLPVLTVLDISRNNIEDISFVQNIPSLCCLNVSFNYIRTLPIIEHNNLRILILGYNYLDGLARIKGFRCLTTLNVSFNMIANNDLLQEVKEMDYLQDVILKGNPIFYCQNYRQKVLDIVSPRVAINFAIDGVALNKRENIYLRKRPMFQIAPASLPPSVIYKEVPIIVATRNEQQPHSIVSDTQSYVSSFARRNIQCPLIATQSDSQSIGNETDQFEPLLRTFPRRKERRIDSMSADDFVSMTTTNSEVISRLESNTYQEELDSPQTPYFVGDKSSSYIVASLDTGWKSYVNVSVQIIEHKLMIVDKSDVIIDNVDLWKLMATTSETLQQDSDTKRILKMVFFVSDNREMDNGGQLILCTRTVEFAKEENLQTFSEQLSLYLQGFSITYDNWAIIPLTCTGIDCKICGTTLSPNYEHPHPYICDKCSGIDFIITNITMKSQQQASVHNSPIVEKYPVAAVLPKIMTPVLKKARDKSSTSNLVIRNFGSMDSLLRRKTDKSSDQSERMSYYTAVDDINTGSRSQDGISDQFADFPSESSTPNKYINDYDDEDGQGITLNLDKPLDSSVLSMKLSVTPTKNDESDAGGRPRLNLDVPIDISMLSHTKEIVPHLCYDNNPRGIINVRLKTPWVVHESSCDVNIYMHNSTKIDDRLKLYFLTKVMLDQEDLVAVFKVFYAYKSAGFTTAGLFVVSNKRVIIFNLLDKISTNMDECIKLSCEFKLKYLQTLEYCLNYQWLEFQFKTKPTLTLYIGDSEASKMIGLSITESISQWTTNFGVLFTKEIEKLKSANLFSTLTSDDYDEVTLETLSKSESYLIRSCSILPCTGKSSLEYGPMMIIIEVEHIFFVSMTYSLKKDHPVFDLASVVHMLHMKNVLVIDSSDDCTVRLLTYESGQDKTIDIKFMSPTTRSKAVLCIDKRLNNLFRVDIIFKMEDLSMEQLL